MIVTLVPVMWTVAGVPREAGGVGGVAGGGEAGQAGVGVRGHQSNGPAHYRYQDRELGP